mmetsp:Transcript_14564/g.43111  ORF Transcript_14564/g.43111 Transcript_14564/m.43111 type:complete len:502 (-) Transcript_14564:89-1594(-)
MAVVSLIGSAAFAAMAVPFGRGKIERPSRNITCGDGVPGVDHAYGDLGPYIANVGTTAACCAHCQANPRCVAWVLETDSHLCFLKAVTSGQSCPPQGGVPCKRNMSNRISMAGCPDGPPPPPPPPPPKHWLPVQTLSAPYRNWSYYMGDYGGFVVPPNAGNFAGQTLTDTPFVFEKTPEDSLPGRYRMTYLWFNGTKGANGYEVGLATSDDLLHWTFGKGGAAGLVFTRNPTPGTYDYGGVTIGGMLLTSSNTTAPRILEKVNGKYWALYGCYPSRAGYEAGDGGQGIASSIDGVTWARVSDTIPIAPGGSSALPPWESRTVYEPFVVAVNGTLWDFYNAAGINEFGAPAEETGLQTLPVAQLPGIDVAGNRSMWVQHPSTPLLPSGPPGTPDTKMASDPKVFYDTNQSVWICLYVCLGDSTGGHADICIAFSTDLIHWDKDETPLYRAGGHPAGIDAEHAHKVSLAYDADGVGYLYYTAVGSKGRGIALITSKDKNSASM